MLMSTDPGDLGHDPTCGSGTTAYVAEQWGRRWITGYVASAAWHLHVSGCLTATFPWYKIKDGGEASFGGFEYQRRQNRKGEEVGGIVPHVTLKSIANNEPPEEEVSSIGLKKTRMSRASPGRSALRRRSRRRSISKIESATRDRARGDRDSK